MQFVEQKHFNFLLTQVVDFAWQNDGVVRDHPEVFAHGGKRGLTLSNVELGSGAHKSCNKKGRKDYGNGRKMHADNAE
jgi:hypothetical protein